MTLLELLELLRKKWYLLVILPLLFAGTTAVYCWCFMANTYTASVTLYVLNQKVTTDSGQQETSPDFNTSKQLANDLAKIAETSTITNSAAEALGMRDLSGFTVDVSSDSNTRIIVLTVTGKNPDATARVANELADRTAEAAVENMKLDAVNVIDRATAPDAPSGPNRPMYTLVALLAGVFAAIALILLLDMLNNSVKSGEEAEELLGLPVLSRMPEVNQKGN